MLRTFCLCFVCVYIPIKAILHQPRTLPRARCVILSWIKYFPCAKRVELVPNQVIGEMVLDRGGHFIPAGIFGVHTLS